VLSCEQFLQGFGLLFRLNSSNIWDYIEALFMALGAERFEGDGDLSPEI
jgi:hypothetical protein